MQNHINQEQANRLIEKYLNGEASPEEQIFVEKFLDSMQSSSDEKMEKEFEKEISPKMWSKVKDAVYAEKKKHGFFKKISPVRYFKYAAILIGFAVAINFLAKKLSSDNELVITEEMITLKTGKEVFGEDEIESLGHLSDNSGEQIAVQEDGFLVYKKVEGIQELVFHEIEVPRGKTYKIKLSDGTKVHLNAGTTLKYPMNFISGMDRKVYLSGEAFFEVSRDINHPFFVNTNNLDIRVLGTSFNVSSYDKATPHAVLVEGSVSVILKESNSESVNERIIVPGQKASLAAGRIEIVEVDVQDYISWRTDQLVFNDEPFSEIIQKIERKYNVEIENMYPELSSVKFNGKFSDESVTDLLETFKASAGFNYKISQNKVVIYKN